MLPTGPVTQPLADNRPEPWTTSQESDYPSRIGGLFVHTQHQRRGQAYGLPSPAPTAPAASPPNWSNHDVAPGAGPWPASPVSPTVGDAVGGGFNNHLLYPTNTAIPVAFDVGFQ